MFPLENNINTERKTLFVHSSNTLHSFNTSHSPDPLYTPDSSFSWPSSFTWPSSLILHSPDSSFWPSSFTWLFIHLIRHSPHPLHSSDPLHSPDCSFIWPSSSTRLFIHLTLFSHLTLFIHLARFFHLTPHSPDTLTRFTFSNLPDALQSPELNLSHHLTRFSPWHFSYLTLFGYFISLIGDDLDRSCCLLQRVQVQGRCFRQCPDDFRSQLEERK